MNFILVLIYPVLVLVLLILFLKVYLKCTSGVCTNNVCLIGKTALITGGNLGIGYRTALALAARGCKVIIASRTADEETKRKIVTQTNNPNVLIKTLDLASLKSVRQLAEDINSSEERLDILINNAGAASLGNNFTEDNLHCTMQINHFGGFLLTHLLIDKLKKSAPSRIIFTTSFISLHTNFLTRQTLNDPFKNTRLDIVAETISYGNSKMCNVLTSNGFAKKLKRTGVTSNTVNPGVVNTEIGLKSMSPFLPKVLFHLVNCILFKFLGKGAHEAPQTLLFVSTEEELKNVTGQYFTDCAVVKQPKVTFDEEFCNAIWDDSEKLVGLRENEKLK